MARRRKHHRRLTRTEYAHALRKAVYTLTHTRKKTSRRRKSRSRRSR